MRLATLVSKHPLRKILGRPTDGLSGSGGTGQTSSQLSHISAKTRAVHERHRTAVFQVTACRGRVGKSEMKNRPQKGMLSQPVSRLQTIFNHFPLPPLTLRLIGGQRLPAFSQRCTVNKRHSPGMPLRLKTPHSLNSRPEPATKSLTVCESQTSFA